MIKILSNVNISMNNISKKKQTKSKYKNQDLERLLSDPGVWSNYFKEINVLYFKSNKIILERGK